MVAVIQFEQCVTGARIFSVVICELGHWQVLCPIILFKVDKDSKVYLYGTVLPLRLSVCLRIKSNGKPPFDAEKVAKR